MKCDTEFFECAQKQFSKDVKDEVVETSGYDVKLLQCILAGNINNVGSSHSTELIHL